MSRLDNEEEFNCFAWMERDEQMWREWCEMNDPALYELLIDVQQIEAEAELQAEMRNERYFEERATAGFEWEDGDGRERGSVWIVVSVLVLVVVVVLSIGIAKGSNRAPVEDSLPYAPTTRVR